MPSQPPVSLSVTVNPRDIARITKRLDKWQGKPLATRMEKAIAGGLNLLRGPISQRAPKRTGELSRSVKVKKLRKQAGEIVRMAVWPTKRVPTRNGSALLTALLVHGANGMTPRPFVDEAAKPLEPAVIRFMDEQVRRLA